MSMTIDNNDLDLGHAGLLGLSMTIDNKDGDLGHAGLGVSVVMTCMITCWKSAQFGVYCIGPASSGIDKMFHRKSLVVRNGWKTEAKLLNQRDK